MTREPLSGDELDLLRKYDTPTVCNVIELFNVRPRNVGFMDKRIQACFPELPPMVGYAATAAFRSAAPSQDDVYSSLEKQVDLFREMPGPPVVVFQDLDDPAVAATFGEVMCTAYQAFGASGLITSGAGRDLPQVRALDFPVFTNGAICAHGYCNIPSIQVPVHVGGVTVHPGDLLHGDSDGVTTIPIDIAGEVGQACEQFVAAEAVLLDYLKSGNVTMKGMAEAQAECHQMMENIRQQVERK
jgi:regulator of RNase E activity RraA